MAFHVAERCNMKILVITSSIDYTVDYIISNYTKVDFYRVNIDMFDRYRLLISPDGWSIESDSGKILSDQVKSIYYRKPMLPYLGQFEMPYRTMIGQDIISTINGIADAFDGLVLTRPSVLRKTENKVYQMQKLRKCQIPFPASLIGNVPDMDFGLEARDKIIKPLTQGKLDLGDKFEFFQTSVLTNPVGDISLTPIYLQEMVKKAYEVRITCLDKYLWPVRIDSSDPIDWRKSTAKNRYELIDVPDHIREMCQNVLKEFGLWFGAFDFIVTPDDEWIFLEVNPNGQWLWLENLLNLDMSKRLVEFLNRGVFS